MEHPDPLVNCGLYDHNVWDVTVQQSLPKSYTPVFCADGRVRMVVRKSDLRDGNVWAFYISPKFVRYLTYDRIPEDTRELLAMVMAETREVIHNVPNWGGLMDYPPPSLDEAGYKIAPDTYMIYISSAAYDYMQDISKSLTKRSILNLKDLLSDS